MKHYFPRYGQFLQSKCKTITNWMTTLGSPGYKSLHYKKNNVNTLSMLRNIAGDINKPIVVQLKATQKCLMSFLLCISEPGAFSIICGNNGILWKSLSCLKDGINTRKSSFDRGVQLIITITEWIILNHLWFSKNKNMLITGNVVSSKTNRVKNC